MSKTRNFEFNFESEFKNSNEVRMYQIPVYKVMLVKESQQTSYVKKITRPDDIYEIAKSYLSGVDREHFVVLMLDTKNQIIGINTVAIGILNSCPVHPREVFKPAIVAGANGVILVHNHPSGELTPSQDDLLLTKRLQEAGSILGIKVIDHIILGDECYLSLKERGQI